MKSEWEIDVKLELHDYQFQKSFKTKAIELRIIPKYPKNLLAKK
jgi:hypothetical protein